MLYLGQVQLECDTIGTCGTLSFSLLLCLFQCLCFCSHCCHCHVNNWERSNPRMGWSLPNCVLCNTTMEVVYMTPCATHFSCFFCPCLSFQLFESFAWGPLVGTLNAFLFLASSYHMPVTYIFPMWLSFDTPLVSTSPALLRLPNRQFISRCIISCNCFNCSCLPCCYATDTKIKAKTKAIKYK